MHDGGVHFEDLVLLYLKIVLKILDATCRLKPTLRVESYAATLAAELSFEYEYYPLSKVNAS